MATKTKETGKTAAEAPAETTALATTGTTALATRESFIDDSDRSGTEDIGMNDVRLPVLRVAQGLSYQMLPDDSRYIPGLALFQMFNDLTGEIYGNGPLKFIPVKRSVAIVEFDPENRGVPLDVNVPPGDPRTFWTKDEEGNSVPPKATTYIEFVVLLVKENADPEPLVISIKTTNKYQTAAAERLSTFIKLQKGPIYSAYKVIRSKSEKNDEGTFGVFVIDNGARLDAPGQSDEEWARSMALFNAARQLHANLEGKTVVYNREEGSTDFPHGANVGEGAAAPQM